MNDDFHDLLQALLEAEVEFLVVGAHALAVHGVPRATGDLDVWIRSSSDNAQRIWVALGRFGAPVESMGLSSADFLGTDLVVQLGQPPRRIDILTGITGVEFASAWGRRVIHRVRDLEVPFLGREDFIANKRATGRTRDLADIEALGGGGE